METAGVPGRSAVWLDGITKTFPGVEASLRGTKLEWKGPALWARNAARAVRLTASRAPAVTALRDITLTIAQGEIYGLAGPNGSGKTTLIKILAGLIRSTTGTGGVAGIPLERSQEIRRHVSYVSTTGWMGLEWPLTAAENVRFFAELCGMEPRLARARTDEALRDVGLWADRDKYPSKLSNGMRQRVILARALLFHTPLVLLDEPTVGLDPLTVRDMLALFRRLCVERGQTLLLTDHQAAEMEALASHIAILADGAVTLSGTPAELRAQLRDVTVIEVHTEEMDPPAAPLETALAVESVERPGPLELRIWRVYAWKSPHALEDALAWITQPRGRVTLVAEREPALSDALALPRAQIAARRAALAAGSQAERKAREGAPE